MSTIKDVAQKAGVSISTVSYALNNKKNVHPDTKERILAVAKELNYTPNLVAKQLKTNETKNIGIFMTHISGFIVNQFVERAKSIFEEAGYNVIISNGKSADQLLLNRYVDAAIVMDLSISNETIGQFASYDSPIYLMDRNLSGTNILAYPVFEEEIVQSFMSEVIKRGYKRYAFLGANKNLLQNQMRYQGFLRALSQHQIENHLYLDGKGTIQSGFQIANDLEYIDEKPDFIFCANDYMAIGLMQGLSQMNIKIPKDIAVSGFDNYIFGNSVLPSLTTLGLDYSQLGIDTAKILLQVIQQNIYSQPANIIYEIIYRKSC